MQTSHRAGIFLIVVAALWPAASVVGQRAGSTSLLVNVVPEAQLNPPRLSLRFTVSADGSADNLGQSSIVTTRVRALPNHPIHVTGRLTGATPDAVFGWSGSILTATGGAQGATCTSGSFAAAPSQELIADWPSSGTISCRIEFRLMNSRALAPGVYTAVVDLAVAE